MTTIITANGTKFVLRNKFGRLVNDENRETISNAFEKLCSFKVEYARNILWHMTYSDYFLDDFDKIGLAEDAISFTEVNTICHELSHQYEKQHPGCFNINVHNKDCKNAFEAFKNATNPLTAYIVYNYMMITLYRHDGSVNHALSLLESDFENKFFGGFRELGFNYEEAKYLKLYHMEAYALLKALYDHKKANSTPAAVFKPFANLGKLVAESGMKLAPDNAEKQATLATSTAYEETTAEAVEEEFLATVEQAAEEIQQMEPSFMSITPETVLQHKDSIEHYLNALAVLSEIGFNPAEVQAKTEQISTLLEAFKAF